jgi:hypothetical protein
MAISFVRTTLEAVYMERRAQIDKTAWGERRTSDYHRPLCSQILLIGLRRWERVRVDFNCFAPPGKPPQFHSFQGISPRVPTKPTNASEKGAD